MTRRELLLSTLASPALLAKTNKIGLSRLSAITDEIARTPADAIAFAKQYGMQWLELRDVPGRKIVYNALPEAELKAAAKEFQDAGIKISFLNTGMLKFGLPGTEPKRSRVESPEAKAKRQASEQKRFADRMDELDKAIRAAHVLGCTKVRVFAFSRVEEPEKVYPRVVDIIGEMAKVAEKEKIQLLLENEASCNVGTSAELATFLKLLPSKALGLNWDPLNAVALKENVFPEGYSLLPKKRIWNVQYKGRSILDYPQKMDWAAILHALEKDGYQGEVGLETHIFGEEQIQRSHESTKAMLKIVGAA
jgi:L-ribulose-5-phosphate 3-epimerase